MKTEIYINPFYSNLNEFINQIPTSFKKIGTVLLSGRNEVRLVNDDRFPLVVKYYKKITFINRIIYATFRKSKAQRAFENSKFLLMNDISTPQPIAYINIYRYGVLYQCYYISVFTFYKPLRELLELPISESEEDLKAFARFTYHLHRAGILHDDFTTENVLYQYNYRVIDFLLIDNNRMRFCQYSYRKGIRNLERLKIPVEKMGIIAAEYAKEANASDIGTLNAMIIFRLGYLVKVSLKMRFKSLIHLMSGKHPNSIVIQRKDSTIKIVNQ